MNDSGDKDLPYREQSGAEFRTVVGPAHVLMPGIKEQWNTLVDKSDSPMPFITWDWFSIWHIAFCLAEEVKLILVYQGDRLVGILPLRTGPERSRRVGLRTLTSCVNTHSFRWSLICESGNAGAAQELAKELLKLRRWDVCHFYIAVSHSRAFEQFLKCLEHGGLGIEFIPDMQSPVMTVPDNWQIFVSTMPRKRRESERRKLRKIEKMGAEVKIIAGSSDDLTDLLQDCWHISSRSWKQDKGSAIAADKARKRFYEEIARSGQEWICLAILYIKQEPIAFEYNLLYADTLYSLKLGYDIKYSSLSPGQVLRFKLLEWCVNRKVIYFDFMGHRARYKDQYASHHIDHSNVQIYSKSVPGRLLGYYRLGVRPVLVRIKRGVMRRLKKAQKADQSPRLI